MHKNVFSWKNYEVKNRGPTNDKIIKIQRIVILLNWKSDLIKTQNHIMSLSLVSVSLCDE